MGRPLTSQSSSSRTSFRRSLNGQHVAPPPLLRQFFGLPSALPERKRLPHSPAGYERLCKRHNSERQAYDGICGQSGRNQGAIRKWEQSPFTPGIHNVYISRNTMRTVPPWTHGERKTAEFGGISLKQSRAFRLEPCRRRRLHFSSSRAEGSSFRTIQRHPQIRFQHVPGHS